MAASEGFKRCSPHDAHLYNFCIKFLRITGIRLPFPMESGSPSRSSFKNNQKYFLKVTLLHGTEQQKIGEFEVVNDECVINHQLTCQISYGRQDVLAKLHVYIDQAWCAGLSGHIAVDLKEFFEDIDAEVYLEYPLFASGPTHASNTAKLQMMVLCTCPAESVTHANQADQDQGSILFEDQSDIGPIVGHTWCPPAQLNTESSHHARPMRLDTGVGQIQEPADLCLEKVDREIHLLKEMEGDLIKLNAKLNRYVAANNWKNGAPGPYRGDVTTRPEVLAAMFFAAGMSFQRQVDRVNQLMMLRDTQDLLLPGAFPALLVEDVSDFLPTLSSRASLSPGTQQGVTFRESSEEGTLLRGESSSDSCGPPQPSSTGSEVAPSCRSMGGYLDEYDSDLGCADSNTLPRSSRRGSEYASPRTSGNLRPPLDKPSCSRSSDGTQTIVHHKSSATRHKLVHVIGSILGAFAIVGLSALGAKDAHSMGRRDRPVPAGGSMVARQQVASIQTVLKSNPGQFH